MINKKRLFLIDAYALIFRGYYAFIKNPRINSKGLDTSAILGFTNSLFDVIKREKPDYIAVCFDKGGSQDRIEIFVSFNSPFLHLFIIILRDKFSSSVTE